MYAVKIKRSDGTVAYLGEAGKGAARSIRTAKKFVFRHAAERVAAEREWFYADYAKHIVVEVKK